MLRNIGKKIISFILPAAVIAVTAVIPLSSARAEVSGGFTYTVKSGDAYITGCESKEPSGVITIPSTVGAYTVKGIDDAAFAECDKITAVVLPSTVKTIGFAAFWKSHNLASVSFGGTVNIGASAFFDCTALKSVTIGENVKVIGASAFNSCDSLQSVKIPSSVESIGQYAFNLCDKLTSVVIPDSVKTISDSAFSGCASLKSVSIGKGVSKIGKEAFLDCGFKSVVIPVGVTSIGKDALGYMLVSDKQIRVTGFSITGCTGTAAHSYAKSNSFGFVPCAHSEASYTIDKSATCTSSGILSVSCDKCAFALSGQVIPATGEHNFTTVTKPATTSSAGSVDVKCSVCGIVKEHIKTISPIGSVSISNNTYIYNGKTQKPVVTVKDKNGVKLSASYYTVKYGNTESKNVGEYLLTVSFKNGYSGSVKKYYKITPRKVVLSGVSSPKKGAIKVSWRKDSSLTGYQVQYSYYSSFKNAASVTTGKKNYVTSYTKTSLNSKKRCYVRIRGYKTVGNKTYYSAWSSAKNVVVK